PCNLSALHLHDALPIYRRTVRPAKLGFHQPGGFVERFLVIPAAALIVLLEALGTDPGLDGITRQKKPQSLFGIPHPARGVDPGRSEEHTSELQSRMDIL